MLKDNGIDARCVRGSGNLKDESGDILVKGKGGTDWLIECKHWSTRTATPGKIRQAWEGIVKKANEEDSEPVLQLRINRKPNRYRVLVAFYTDPKRWAEISEETFIYLIKEELARGK